MVNLKQVIFSFIIPITATIIVPFLLLWLVEARVMILSLNESIFYLIMGFMILGTGFILFLNCILLFYKRGKGTLAPISKIETKKLVIRGPYKYVRNPMIIGVILMLLGESLILNSMSILIFAILFIIINVIYMPLSEEKGLIKRFGEEYLHYKENVRAWIPKIHPYSMEKVHQDDSLENNDKNY